MGKYPIKKIRTLALVGQAGSGKTALAHALLVRAGALGPEGSSEHANSTCDYLPIEKRLHHSLKLAVASFEAHKLEPDTKAPSIAFRETIADKAEGHARHKKQTFPNYLA